MSSDRLRRQIAAALTGVLPDDPPRRLVAIVLGHAIPSVDEADNLLQIYCGMTLLELVVGTLGATEEGVHRNA